MLPQPGPPRALRPGRGHRLRPRGELRPLSELVAAAEDAGFSVETTVDLTRHYHRTIEQWTENVRANAAALNRIRPGIAAQLEHYLDVSNAGWGYTTKHYALVLRNAR
ncbi:class I SAM-dependent methyltransferase [Pseudonocardia xishanensis]|uniref:class I SAM-dependent methyltransferase n=1 Tax=Pseudonocardia xishanensis TaxID=630995 RepID=UPI0031EFC78E